VVDLLICCVDGLKGVPDAIEALFLRANSSDVRGSPHTP
jgi:hypothetical protein